MAAASGASARIQRTSKRWRIGSAGLYGSLAIFSVLVVVPFYWMTKAALTAQNDLFRLPPGYLPTWTLDNFGILADQVPLARYVWNSTAFATLTTLATVAVSFLAAYAFARLRVRGSSVLLWVLVLSMALPEIVTLIPLYQLLRNLGLLDSVLGLTLIMSGVLTPFTVWVLVAFIEQIPTDIEEAATIDGASLVQVFWFVVLPLVAPALATVAVINFVNAWNNLLYPLAFSASSEAKTLSVALTEVFQARAPWGRPWNLVSALGVTMVAPVVMLVIFSQRAIVQGLTRGAVK